MNYLQTKHHVLVRNTIAHCFWFSFSVFFGNKDQKGNIKD